MLLILSFACLVLTCSSFVPSLFCYVPVLMEDILSPYCMLENNNYLVGDSPDIWFYKCGIWTNESKDILNVIAIWVVPNGLTVEASRLSTCGSVLCKHYQTMQWHPVCTFTPFECRSQTKKMPKWAVRLPPYKCFCKPIYVILLHVLLSAKFDKLYLSSYPH